jgi:hypothetical protein
MNKIASQVNIATKDQAEGAVRSCAPWRT